MVCTKRIKKALKNYSVILLLFVLGCSPGLHHGHIFIHDSNHIEAVFERPMSMSVERDGVKVEASSLKPGFFEDVLKFLLLKD